ncbi:hypothetical protein SAMN06265182_0070 [Persephonella hydrogeniphila]|uniref:Uncharacterized protein n=1 Tax=Persephonella hydrogeniphila TaxID=198703 RepID=A0A285MYK1_9AQUI|nr:hypothetical protein [Persephonella hydrogeniphila]SNZ02265.1 hypothetical protein SAMN06265182_0070 [Persephonella hydrogeniphila]
MKRDFYILMTGFFSGLIFSLYLYRKRKKILEKLNEIENRVRNIQVKNFIRSIVYETTSNIRKLLTNTKGVPLKEKEYILKKVEEKIRRLEEIV